MTKPFSKQKFNYHIKQSPAILYVQEAWPILQSYYMKAVKTSWTFSTIVKPNQTKVSMSKQTWPTLTTEQTLPNCSAAFKPNFDFNPFTHEGGGRRTLKISLGHPYLKILDLAELYALMKKKK